MFLLPHRLPIPLAALLLTACGELPYVPLPGGPAGALHGGDLIIHEVMVSPDGCGPQGQYLELINATDAEVDLQGLILSDGTGTWTVTAGTIPARAFGLGRPAGSTGCYPREADFTWEGLTFSHDPGARVVVSNAASVLDAVNLAGWADGDGRAWALRPDHVSTTGNDPASAWCLSDDAIASLDDFGSPGGPNVSCASSTPDDTDEPGVITRTLDSLAAGDLVITELFHTPVTCAPGTAQYVEVHNTTDDIVDLAGLLLSNGTVTVELDVAPNLPAGGYVYLAAGDPGAACFADAVTPNGAYPDTLTIIPGDTLAIGVGAPLTAFDSAPLGDFPWMPGVALQLASNRLTATDNDQPAAWCDATTRIAPGTDIYELGSPGEPNHGCFPTVITPVRFGDELLAGDLVITEVMADPATCDDHEAEYFEVYNNTGVDIDLQGVSVWVGGLETRLTTSFPVAAGAWALAETSGGSGYVASCYVGLRNDLLWNTGPMPDEGTRIELRNELGTIDAVDLTDELAFDGRALQLEPTALDATSNDDMDNWCLARSAFFGSRGDLGSPRAANPSCTIPDTDTDLGLPILDIGDLVVGDLIITEFLPNPEDCSDFAAEYIEVYNTTDAIIRLDDLIVSIGGISDPLWVTRALLMPDQHGLLVYRTGSTSGCYGLFDHGRYTSGRMNDTNPVIYIANGTGILDQVNATGWPLVVPGEAVTLDPSAYDPLLNDDVALWCLTDTLIPGGISDQGSPAIANAPCPLVPHDTDSDAPPVDTDTDTGSSADSDDTFEPVDTEIPVDTEVPVDTDLPPPVVVNAASLQAGDLVITEFLADPQDCSDFQGEYIEFFNTTPYEVDPLGLLVRVGNQTLAATSLNHIAPGAYGIARYSTGSIPTCGGQGYVSDVLYAAGRMDNGGSTIGLANPSRTIDEVQAAGWGILAPGVAAILDPAATNAVSNDQPTNWCAATTTIPGGIFDKGSPRVANADPTCFP
jgi:hypothetical protein